MQLLAVEDEDAIAVPLAEGLAREGFEVERVATGAAALEATEPDLVLLDIRLPGIDGIEVALRLGQHEDPPAVVLTSSRDGIGCESIFRACGARGFIPKAELSGDTLTALAA